MIFADIERSCVSREKGETELKLSTWMTTVVEADLEASIVFFLLSLVTQVDNYCVGKLDCILKLVVFNIQDEMREYL